jgi:formylglycine-generating enzyme required for sulfatase activity
MQCLSFAYYLAWRNRPGNVCEWCQDRWDEDAYRRRWDGITAEEAYCLGEKYGNKKMHPLRGGSWFTRAGWCRSSRRDRDWADVSFGDDGLRACLIYNPFRSGILSH